jgi:hypothetical protein
MQLDARKQLAGKEGVDEDGDVKVIQKNNFAT